MSLAGLISSAAKAELELLGSLTQPKRPWGCRSCEIPPPCWVPEPLGAFTSAAVAGGSGMLRLTIVNCATTDARTIMVTATNATVGAKPASLSLGPMEEGMVELAFPIPAGSLPGQTQRTTVWIGGCREYVLRWTVVVASTAVTSHGAKLEIDDCPDLVHHWYDHFYCARPCPTQR
jgi:hypothetical protein